MKKLLLPLLILGISGLFNQASSQKIFMKVNASGYTFEGTSMVRGYEHQISVQSFSDGLVGCSGGNSNMSSGTSGGCKTSLTDFSMIIPLSLATIDFKSAMLQGKILSDVDMVQVASGANGSLFESYKIHMENVTITSIQDGGSAGGGNPFISVTLSPTKIAWEVLTQNSTGGPGNTSSYGWDFAKNSPFNYHF